jgi:sulfite exporter TauE/SafE
MEIPAALVSSLFALGLATGVHCLGMCGGVVAAFGTQRVAIVRDARAGGEVARQLAFNAGRISSYAVAGAAAGLLAGFVAAQVALHVLANLMLVLVGLQLAGAGTLLSRFETLGAPLWRRISPHAGRMLFAPTLPRAFLAGTLWGWLPCGFVYGALAIAALAGSPAGGAATMAAFGLGTLPWLLAAGVGAAKLRALLAQARWRVAIGGLILGSGVFGLAHAATRTGPQWVGFICV